MFKIAISALLLTASVSLGFPAAAQNYPNSLPNPPNDARIKGEIQEMQRNMQNRNREIEQRAIQQQREADYRLREDQERMRRENMPDDNRGVIFQSDRNQRPYDPRYNNGYGSNGNTDGGRMPMPGNARAPIWAEPLIPGMDRGRIIQRGQYDMQPDNSCQLQTWQGTDNQSYRRWVCS